MQEEEDAETVVVTFAYEEEAIKSSSVPLEMAEWALLPTLLDKSFARVGISRIPPNLKDEWLVPAVLAGMNMDV